VGQGLHGQDNEFKDPKFLGLVFLYGIKLPETDNFSRKLQKHLLGYSAMKIKGMHSVVLKG